LLGPVFNICRFLAAILDFYRFLGYPNKRNGGTIIFGFVMIFTTGKHYSPRIIKKIQRIYIWSYTNTSRDI